MADPALGVVMETVLKTIGSLVAEEIGLAWGVHEELKRLAQKQEMIRALLSDAQSKQFTSNTVQEWLQRLGSVALDAQIVLDEFGYEVLRQKVECRKRDKVRTFFSSSSPVAYRSKIAHEINDVMSSLEGLFAESNRIGLQEVINSPPPHLQETRSTDSLVDDSDIVGRNDDTSEVINMLVGSDYERDLPVITILGMGGQGKTTLAQLVYKNDKVQSYFNERVWVCVSDDFNTERLSAKMLESFETETNPHLTNVGVLGKLKEKLSGKRYLLVLDDVWNTDGGEWNRMRTRLLELGGSKGSKVLATTRSEEVAKTMRTSQPHRLQVLSDEQSWKLFEKWAFADSGAKKPLELVEIGKRILKRCGGVPLAIRVIGGLLYLNNCESEWSRIERSEWWRDEGKEVFSAIKLSYDHLPALALKQCFAYCAIFQKDKQMNKDELIQLWMAQGLLNPPNGSPLQMEDIGSKYFHILLRSSLLEDAQKDGSNNITRCKMHDLVHDVSLQVSENYCFHVKDWKDVKDEIKAVHLSISASEGGFPKSLKDIVPSKLRTLHLKGRFVLVDLFANCKCLTVLILEDENIKELPNSIGKMKHLRFFDISSCGELSRLPKSFTELYYLQTLKVYKLDKVPKGFWKLINLRHFYVRSIGEWSEFSVPKVSIPRLSQLTNLQSLSFYKVDKCNGCQIEELEHLDNLKGDLTICGLQNVRTHESALKSNLSKKSEVQTLYLHWHWQKEEDCDVSDVMEGLKPHSNLKSLTIDGYQSPKFPSWMTARNDLKLLGNLVKLILRNLNKCEQLPSLGHLPCLEHLEIDGLNNVRRIGEEFYGWSNLDWVKKSNCSNGSQITLFPSLKVFKLWHMRNLVGWSDAIVPAHAAYSSVKVFPVLEDMEIRNLPELCSFPNLGCLPKLRRLNIIGCRRLTLPSNWNDHDSCVVSSSEGPSSSSACPPDDDDLVVNVPNVHYLPSLREVTLYNCDKFTAPFCSLKILAPLESLEIRCSLSLWPKDLRHLINLRSLLLGADYMSKEEVDCFPFPYSISNVNVRGAPEDVQYFPSLTFLNLVGHGLPNVTSLSDQIQYLTSLRDLTIQSFDRLEPLPEWLGNLTSLQNLVVLICKNLKQLPSAEAFQRLTNLQSLRIVGCSNYLKEACTQGSGSEWPKIAHIPNLEVY